MLIELNIRNIALIESLRIEFTRGLNVLTGETGAGKSIVVDCVNLALGGRADRDLIRTGEERGGVRALFDVSGNPAAEAYLAELGVETQDGLAEVSREITRSGKNVCRVNGAMLLLSQIKTFTGMLVDVHGQHEHQALMDPARHIEFLDSFGGERIRPAKERVQAAYADYADTKRRLDKADIDEAERARRVDALSFQYKEISSAKLKPDEEEALEQKNRIYENAERISSHVRTAYERVYLGGGKSVSAMEGIKRALDAMKAISGIDEKYQTLAGRLEEIYYSVSDVGYELQDAMEETTFDPEDAERVADRLDQIKKLKRKYGPELKDVIEFGRRAGEELKQLEASDELREELKAALKERKRALDEACAALTDARREAAAELCRRLVEQLADLGMGRTRFDVRFTPRAPQADGADEVEFILSPNPGEPMKPLSAIASGGEISRIMLAMKAISAENEGVDTMIFDEIDTGVSGRMAQTVGEKMCALGRSRQVICVTHLAQIVALGDSQYLVEKTVKDGHTGSSVRRLDEEGRVGELARLVGGADDSASGREHARSMLAAAETLKKKRF